MIPRAWTAASIALAALFALAIAGDLLWMPIQVDDALGEILDAGGRTSVTAAFTGSIGTEAYLRPARIAQIQALFQAAQGEHYWLAYRGFHAVLLVSAVLLFAAALRPDSGTDFAAAAIALTVLVGLHTFRGTVQEAFPINHFLEMIVGALIVVNLARGRPAPWKDVAAPVTLAGAVLTLESGLLVWVAAAAAWTVGWRGISRRGLAVMTLVVIGYFGLRFVYLDTGVPTLAERSSGYLFAMLDPPELEARFGDRPLLFYAYNVAASAISVLFSEPRAGVFAATAGFLDGGIPPRLMLWLATSIGMTAIVAWAMVRSLAPRRKAPYELDDNGRLLIVFVVMLAANAALSFAYTKDEIMSVAGVFYAMAAYAALRQVLTDAARSRAALSIVVMFVVALASAWSVRAVGVHYLLRSQAVKHQYDWAVLPHKWHREGRWPEAPETQRLILELRDDAIGMTLPNTRIGRPEWADRIWTD